VKPVTDRRCREASFEKSHAGRGIEARDLLTVGYGQKQLKNSENPFAGENRRVQVVNADDR